MYLKFLNYSAFLNYIKYVIYDSSCFALIFFIRYANTIVIITIAQLIKICNTRFTNQESLYYTFISIRDSHQEQIKSPFYDIITQVVVDKNRRYITRACSQFPGRVSCQHLTRKSSNALVMGKIDNRAAFSSRTRGNRSLVRDR